MRKRAKWSRPKKTLRNWALVVMMAVALYMIGDFPALTKRALVNEMLRDNLMDKGEIVWEEKDWQGYRKLYVMSGDTVLRSSYYWNVLVWGYTRWESELLYGHDGVTCIPSSGTPGKMLAFGNFPEAASAVLELYASRSRVRERDREYTAEGVFESDRVISFALAETYEDDKDFFADSLRKTVYPEAYYDYTLRLYDAAGQEIGMWTDIPGEGAA